VFLVQNGHISIAYREDLGVNNNPVYQIMTDYQDHVVDGGGGKMRVLIFRPNENRIDAKVYTPWNDTLETYQYSMFYSMNNAPVAIFNASIENAIPPFEVVFNASLSYDLFGDIVEYSWDFENDGVPDDFGEQVTYNFAVLGTFEVNLTVTDNDGNKSSVTKDIISRNPECSDTIDNDYDENIDENDIGCWQDILDSLTYDPDDDSEFSCEDIEYLDFYDDGILNMNDKDVWADNRDLYGGQCPDLPELCPWDINGDGDINTLDRDILVEYIAICYP
jgi:hypothetical protein